MPTEPFSVPRGDQVTLAGERSGRAGAPAVVFLHAGVADRRSWLGVFDELADADLDLVAYDRRGYGGTAAGEPGEEFTHLDDLVALLDALGLERVVVVGNSMGGALALDFAATAPERVAALVLVAAGVSGMTDEGEDEPYLPDPAAAALEEAIAAADGDLDEQARLTAHLWLDGPTQPEGRVGGPARELALAMIRRILDVGAPDGAGSGDLDTWSNLAAIDVPTIAAWGDLDIPADLIWYARTAERLPRASARILHGVAHLPSLEQPEVIAGLVRQAVAG